MSCVLQRHTREHLGLFASLTAWTGPQAHAVSEEAHQADKDSQEYGEESIVKVGMWRERAALILVVGFSLPWGPVQAPCCGDRWFAWPWPWLWWCPALMMIWEPSPPWHLVPYSSPLAPLHGHCSVPSAHRSCAREGVSQATCLSLMASFNFS